MSDLDAALDIPVDPNELRNAEIEFTKESEAGHVSAQTTFNYAVFLLHSKKSDILLGLRLLEELLSDTKDGDAIRDYLYYLGVGNTKLKNFDAAMSYVDAILRVEPTNGQALELKNVINKRMRKEGLIGGAMLAGMAMFGGAALAAALAVFSHARRSK